jgi:hypothetical protein
MDGRSMKKRKIVALMKKRREEGTIPKMAGPFNTAEMQP